MPLLLMFGVLYFILIRPQMTRQKEHKAMIDAIAKGDEVVTAGGLIGRVAKLGDSYVHVEIANNTEIDLIWDERQKTLEPLRVELNRLLKTTWAE